MQQLTLRWRDDACGASRTPCRAARTSDTGREAGGSYDFSPRCRGHARVPLGGARHPCHPRAPARRRRRRRHAHRAAPTARRADEPAGRLLKGQRSASCGDAVASMERDLEERLAHYEMPRKYRDALRTTNPIERVNKEFKRRTKSMDHAGVDTPRVMLRAAPRLRVAQDPRHGPSGSSAKRLDLSRFCEMRATMSSGRR